MDQYHFDLSTEEYMALMFFLGMAFTSCADDVNFRRFCIGLINKIGAASPGFTPFAVPE